MKKLLVFSMVFVSFVSCKEKLPSNIGSAISSIEFDYEVRRDFDSVIVSMDKISIDKLTRDSLRSLVFKKNWYEDKDKKNKTELDELLKYNPKYSDFSEVKNIKQPYYYKEMGLYFRNTLYIELRKMYLDDKHYGIESEVPKYED